MFWTIVQIISSYIYNHFCNEYGADQQGLVMNCLGSSLGTFLGSNQKMDQERSSRIAVQALDILKYVDSEGAINGNIGRGGLLRGRNGADALYCT